jgi:hypothetical protein
LSEPHCRLAVLDLGRRLLCEARRAKIAEKRSASSAGEALAWLRDQAILQYPVSEFAARHAGFGFSTTA